jgi:hypothetical protein
MAADRSSDRQTLSGCIWLGMRPSAAAGWGRLTAHPRVSISLYYGNITLLAVLHLWMWVGGVDKTNTFALSLMVIPTCVLVLLAAVVGTVVWLHGLDAVKEFQWYHFLFAVRGLSGLIATGGAALAPEASIPFQSMPLATLGCGLSAWMSSVIEFFCQSIKRQHAAIYRSLQHVGSTALQPGHEPENDQLSQ